MPHDDANLERQFHPNGAVKAEVPLRHGKTYGTVRTWHDNGRLASEAQHVFGMIVGVSRSWDEDGRLVAEMNYVLPEAVYGRTHWDPEREQVVCLWNGKLLSKARWTAKVLATGMTQVELDQKLAASVSSAGPSAA